MNEPMDYYFTPKGTAANENSYMPVNKHSRIAQRLLQYCQLPDKISSYIFRDTWNISFYFQIRVYIYSTIFRGATKRVLRNPKFRRNAGWEKLQWF